MLFGMWGGGNRLWREMKRVVGAEMGKLEGRGLEEGVGWV